MKLKLLTLIVVSSIESEISENSIIKSKLTWFLMKRDYDVTMNAIIIILLTHMFCCSYAHWFGTLRCSTYTYLYILIYGSINDMSFEFCIEKKKSVLLSSFFSFLSVGREFKVLRCDMSIQINVLFKIQTLRDQNQ